MTEEKKPLLTVTVDHNAVNDMMGVRFQYEHDVYADLAYRALTAAIEMCRRRRDEMEQEHPELSHHKPDGEQTH